jgi:predicted transcriptional regulator
MIDQFKELEMRHSGLIYEGTFEQIKKLHEVDPQLAGELAISAIEFVLTGEISSDDMMVNLLLEPMRTVNQNNKNKYEEKVESARMKKITDMKLDKIAEMAREGCKQREIGERLGLSQQIISYRMGVIKTSYPELLTGSPQADDTNKNTKIQKNFTNDTNEIQKNKNTNENVCTNFVQNYKNTNDTNFVQNSVCKNQNENAEIAKEQLKKLGFSF